MDSRFSQRRYSRLKYSRTLWCFNCLLFCSIYFQYSLTSFLSFKRPQLRKYPKSDTCLYEPFWSQSPGKSSPTVMSKNHGSLCIVIDISKDLRAFVFAVIERWELLTNQHDAISQTNSIIRYLQCCSWKYKCRETYCTMQVAKCTFVTLHSCTEKYERNATLTYLSRASGSIEPAT